MDFIDCALPLDDFTVQRDLLAGPHPQPIADRDRFKANFLVGAFGVDASHGLRRKVEQGPDRAAGLLPCAEFENLAEQHEDGNRRRRLEIDGDRAVHSPKVRREQARRNRGDDAVGPGDARAHGDQREHIEIAVPERRPCPLEKWPAGPQHDRRRENELNPVQNYRRKQHMEIGEMSAHCERNHRDRKGQRNPKAPGHINEFRARASRFGGDFRLQRHAADRASAGVVLTNLWMHRAGVDRAHGRGFCWERRCREVNMLVRGDRRCVSWLHEESRRVSRRTFRGSQRSKNSESRPRDRLCAWPSPDQPACRRRGPSRANLWPRPNSSANVACVP